MRYSQMLIPTTKEVPSDAKVPSHILLLRGGYIRQVAAGIFTLLPLGQRVVQKVQRIVREELNRSGAQEVLLPIVHPAPLWRETGRYDLYGPHLLRFKDRKEFDFVLSPTAEEAMVAMVRDEVKTYRKLPINLYQIQDKFRDEDRPRAGLLRGREFIMKDAYSFHADEECAKREYQNMYDAYCRIFSRCGLKYRAVEADTGAIGGSLSHEFQVLADTGEDNIVSCASCNYTANVEKAVLVKTTTTAPVDPSTVAAPVEIATPGVGAIAEVVEFLFKATFKPEIANAIGSALLPTATHDNKNKAAWCEELTRRTVKTLIYVADGKPVAVLIRGDRQLNEPKLKTLLGAGAVAPATDALVREVSGAEVGSIGPRGLTIPVYADFEVAEMGPCITGANKVGFHVANLLFGRDFTATVADLRVAASGDRCGRCQNGDYRHYRGIEAGHVFFLGTKYSVPMRCEFLDQHGQLKPMVMGCYGIGITRVVAAAVEQNNDANGIIWPLSLAPFQVVVVAAGVEDEIQTAAQTVYKGLLASDIEVLYDDRDERPGVKFKDADLLGIPLRITVGKKSLAEGAVELKRRDGTLDTKLPLAEVVAYINELVKKELVIK